MLKNKFRVSYNNYFGLAPKRCRNFFLIQAGESLCAKDTVVPEHEQACFEITFVKQGKGISYVNDTPVPIEKGDCFFSFPDERHQMRTDENDPLRFVFLAFYAKERSQGDTLIHYLTQTCKNASARKYKIEELAPLCNSLLLELRNEDMYSTRIIGFLLEQILIECCRNISKKTKKYPLFNQTSEAVLAHDIITYIDKNIFEIKKLSELENTFYYNINYLSKCFHSQMGIPINKYFISKKMEMAFQLLENGKSVTEISDMLGYSSIHSFSRAYKNYFNQPPSQHKKKD